LALNQVFQSIPKLFFVGGFSSSFSGWPWPTWGDRTERMSNHSFHHSLTMMRMGLYGYEANINKTYITYDHLYTSSTAQGGGGSFKNRKPIGEVGCCESGMAERSH